MRLPLTSRGCSVRCLLLEKQASARTVPPEAGLRFFPLPTGSPKPGGVCSLCLPASLSTVPARAWQSPGDASKGRRESAAEPTGWRRAGGGGAGVGAGGPGISGSLRVLWAGASRDNGQWRLPRVPASMEDAARPKLSGQVLHSVTDSARLFLEGTWTRPWRVGVGFESGHLPGDSGGQRLPLGGRPPPQLGKCPRVTPH